MADTVASLVTVLVLMAAHIYAGSLFALNDRWRSKTLSAAAGLGIAYIFLELLPSLADQYEVIEGMELLPVIDRDVYILALLGLCISFWVETASRASRRRQRQAGKLDMTEARVFWFSMLTFAILNASIGYALAIPGDEAVNPYWLFAIAMGLHTLVNDHSLAEHHGQRYRRLGRWLLAASVLLGWCIGIVPGTEIPEEALAPVLAYLAGGTILNILRHELPDTDRLADFGAFFVGACAYGGLLLALG